MQESAAASMQLENVIRVDREQAAVDRQNLLSQITDLAMSQGVAQDQRFEEKTSGVQKVINLSRDLFEVARV